jgi:hypothetical protein
MEAPASARPLAPQSVRRLAAHVNERLWEAALQKQPHSSVQVVERGLANFLLGIHHERPAPDNGVR